MDSVQKKLVFIAQQASTAALAVGELAYAQEQVRNGFLGNAAKERDDLARAVRYVKEFAASLPDDGREA